MFKFVGTRKEFTAWLQKTFTARAIADELVIDATVSVKSEQIQAKPITGPRPVFEACIMNAHLLALQGQKISAIKAYREATGYGLVEAKDYIEKFLSVNDRKGLA